MNDNPYATPKSRFENVADTHTRKPWVAVVWAIFVPPLALLYVARPLRALMYLLALILSLPVAAFLAGQGMGVWELLTAAARILFSLAAGIDAYRLAKAWGGDSPPWYARAPALVGVLAVAVLGVVSLRLFVVEPFRIPSGAMEPTLHVGDHILASKSAYGWEIPYTGKRMVRFAGPERGEVALFRYPQDPSIIYVKRVVGVPGDKVEYRDKRLTINGREVPVTRAGEFIHREKLHSTPQFMETLDDTVHAILLEPEAPPSVPHVTQYSHRDKCSYDSAGVRCEVPPNHYFVMGDNRDASNDSRVWGFVPDELLIGRAVFFLASRREPERAGKAIR
jgi:signal peptidase I